MTFHPTRLTLAVAVLSGWATFGPTSGLRAEEKPAPAVEAPAAEATPEEAPPRVQLAILLDTSGSMDGLINQARTQLWKIVNELATAKRDGEAPALEVALYEYGKSSLAADEGFLRQITPLTDDLDKVSEELFALNTNGGEEYCGWVIRSATKGLKWSDRDEDLKLIFVCGNEAFTQGSVDYKESVQAAIERGITVNTIFCGPRAEGVNTMWEDGAKLADGAFTVIDQNQKVAEIETPFDDKLATLGVAVNKTYVRFGEKAERKKAALRQLAADEDAEKAAPGAAATRAAFKGKQQYRGANDLVDALKDGAVQLDDIADAELPEELRKLDAEGREKYVAEKRAEREKIQKEINDLDAKRREYIAAERKKQAEKTGKASLDEAVLKAVREQAGRKKYEFEN